MYLNKFLSYCMQKVYKNRELFRFFKFQAVSLIKKINSPDFMKKMLNKLFNLFHIVKSFTFY